jgi:glycosyltransferase involved in cell wall biosynthesis
MVNVWIVMPAYNEEDSIGTAINNLHAEGWRQIIVVNDGSRDRTGEIATMKGAIVVNHKKNSGLGAALRTGLAKARGIGADIAITFDSDGQHDAKAVQSMVDGLKGADLAIGARYFIDAPLHKRLGNFWFNLITRVMGGIVTDSQSGMRALNQKALRAIKIKSNRYEVSSEIIIRAKQAKLKIKEVKVECKFTPYSKARGTTIASGIRIFIGLVKLRLGAARAQG